MEQQSEEQIENEYEPQNELEFKRDDESSFSSGGSDQAEEPLLNNGAPFVTIDTFSSKINDVIDLQKERGENTV